MRQAIDSGGAIYIFVVALERLPLRVARLAAMHARRPAVVRFVEHAEDSCLLALTAGTAPATRATEFAATDCHGCSMNVFS